MVVAAVVVAAVVVAAVVVAGNMMGVMLSNITAFFLEILMIP